MSDGGAPRRRLREETTLVDLLDRLIDRGVAVTGDVVISVAEVDLVHLGLQLVLHGIDQPGAPGLSGPPRPARTTSDRHDRDAPPRGRRGDHPPFEIERSPEGDVGGAAAQELRRLVVGGGSGELDPEEVQRGLASLVLTLVEVLHELMERQALRRMDAGTLTDDEIERVGRTFLALNERMTQLKQAFGLTDEDLTLDLGPLGRLR